MQSEADTSLMSDSEVVDRIVRSRKTCKLMLPLDQLDRTDTLWSDAHRTELKIMVEGAAWAPFHRRADEATHRQGELDSVVPWRFHVLEQPACHALLRYLQQQTESQPESKWSRAWQSKIKNMLAGCGALIQATWLPDPSADGGEPALTPNNCEHLAAGGAAIQNVLLAAEARGWKSYWSSGGILRDEEVFEHLGIGRQEVLLGSLFLAPTITDGCNEIEGGLREQRGCVDSWSRWIE